MEANVPVDLYDIETEKNHSFIAGGIINHNSLGVEHRVMRHLWETPGARAVLVTKTHKVGKDGGVWADMTEIIMPEWLNANIVGISGLPLEYTSESRGIAGPRMDAATRTSSFRIRNYWGGESEFIHFSLDNVDEVEAKFKGTRFSLVWFSELSEFNSRNVFTATIQQLRIGQRKDQMFVADTNPAVEGTEFWAYQLWYLERQRKDHSEPLFQRELKLIEVFLEDNPFLSEADMAELRGSNLEMNEGDYDRNVNGKWRKGFGHRGKLFSHLIVESLHFIGPAIDVSKDQSDLYTGWDIGASKNHAFVILEKKSINDLIIWCVLDELVCVDDTISTEEFAWQAWEKIRKLEEFYDRKFNWTHWSDSSAWENRSSSADGYDAAIVERVTQGAIELIPVEKPQQSVATGIRIIGRLLRETRLFIGNNCPKVQQMLSEVSEGKTKPVDDTEFKHPFDALRYPIYMESRRYEAELSTRPRGVDRDKPMLLSFG